MLYSKVSQKMQPLGNKSMDTSAEKALSFWLDAIQFFLSKQNFCL